MRPVTEPRFLIVLLALALGACAGPRASQPKEEAPETRARGERQVDWAAVEDFDPAPYRDEAPDRDADVKHDVPASLMKPAPVATRRTGSGFRIQLAATTDRAAADRAAADAVSYWSAQTGATPAVYVVFLQPYYRVRLGNFGSRAEAQRALSGLQARFPGALIVPDTVVLGGN